MDVTVSPSKLKGEIKAPPSKSVMQRAVAAAILCTSPTKIKNPSYCDDGLAALEMAEQLGARVEKGENSCTIFPNEVKAGGNLNCGESGLGSRLFTCLAALQNHEIQVDGKGSLRNRPFSDFEMILPQLEVEFKTTNGHLPLSVKGPAKAGEIEVDASSSSQFLSGLLMILPTLEGDSTVKVKNLKSRPYIDMTLDVMKHFGVEVENQNYEIFKIKGKQNYSASEIEIDGDWSGAAFLFVAAVVTQSELKIASLKKNPNQGDSQIVDVLQSMGAQVKEENDSWMVSAKTLTSFEFDATNCPDLFPPLAVLAVLGNAPSKIKGVHRLKHKESDRGKVLIEMLSQAGIRSEIENDEMIIFPGKPKACTINSYNDHRIAMAAAVLGLAGEGVTIEDAEAVSKSWPGFFEDLGLLRAKI
ncbi:3-phosphoshikimate 1-carboxyvinyltransferase [Halocola ammonii]